jgi:MFS family permease/quinol monooxygenase YgiN
MNPPGDPFDHALKERLPPALQPLASAWFRMLWLAWAAANLTMWMNDVAAAWLMTELTHSAVLVALVQAASTAPTFLLGLPSGALADIVDRRRWFAATQVWVAGVALVLALLALLEGLSPPLLLALTFANGIGLAMRWPVFAAIVPGLVGRDQLSAALGLNAIAMNVSRIVGPMLAGALLAGLGTAAVFAVNAVLAITACVLILRWPGQPHASALPGERFVGAMRVGLQHVRQSPRLRAVLLRVFLFFFQAIALQALVPLLAQALGGGAGSYTLMLAAMGSGAVGAALAVGSLRERYSRDQIVRAGTLVQAAMMVLAALAPSVAWTLPALVVAGMAWIATANTLTMSAQLALPNWVRARGMAVYQMALMGGNAAGAACWGQVAGKSSVPVALMAAAACGVSLLLLTWNRTVQGSQDEDLTPVPRPVQPVPAIPVEPDEGPVMVTVEYHVDAARAEDFAAVMELTRQARLRQGSLSWGLFRDTEVPGRYVEYFVDESWVEHLRRLERFTEADVQLRSQRQALHVGSDPPVVRRYVAHQAS